MARKELGFPTVVLPEGSQLFHGTLEDLRGDLSPGGYDDVLWFADSPAVAQLYISRSGISMYASSSNIGRPSRDPYVRTVQRAIGLDFDLDDVRWGPTGRAESYPIPKGWEDVDLNLAWDREVERRLAALGYEGKGRSGWKQYELLFSDGKLLPPGGIQEGTLCVATTLRDMRLWKKALGEGDLTEVQYHDIPGFERALAAGLDGVLIDDFAQSEEWGNLGHLSVGLFEPALTDLSYVCVPATYEEYDGRATTQAWPHEPNVNFYSLFFAKTMRNKLLR